VTTAQVTKSWKKEVTGWTRTTWCVGMLIKGESYSCGSPFLQSVKTRTYLLYDLRSGQVP
jgi:hypothetical protein